MLISTKHTTHICSSTEEIHKIKVLYVNRYINPFPGMEHSLCRFIAYLASENLKANSIRRYLSACHQLQITLGLGDPFEKRLPLLEYVLKGIKSDQAKRMAAGRSRLPISPDILQWIWKV